jgi:hypothetical protein
VTFQELQLVMPVVEALVAVMEVAQPMTVTMEQVVWVVVAVAPEVVMD